jgi:hypothetical protein
MQLFEVVQKLYNSGGVNDTAGTVHAVSMTLHASSMQCHLHLLHIENFELLSEFEFIFKKPLDPESWAQDRFL